MKFLKSSNAIHKLLIVAGLSLLYTAQFSMGMSVIDTGSIAIGSAIFHCLILAANIYLVRLHIKNFPGKQFGLYDYVFFAFTVLASLSVLLTLAAVVLFGIFM